MKPIKIYGSFMLIAVALTAIGLIFFPTIDNNAFVIKLAVLIFFLAIGVYCRFFAKSSIITCDDTVSLVIEPISYIAYTTPWSEGRVIVVREDDTIWPVGYDIFNGGIMYNIPEIVKGYWTPVLTGIISIEQAASINTAMYVRKGTVDNIEFEKYRKAMIEKRQKQNSIS